MTADQEYQHIHRLASLRREQLVDAVVSLIAQVREGAAERLEDAELACEQLERALEAQERSNDALLDQVVDWSKRALQAEERLGLIKSGDGTYASNNEEVSPAHAAGVDDTHAPSLANTSSLSACEEAVRVASVTGDEIRRVLSTIVRESRTIGHAETEAYASRSVDAVRTLLAKATEDQRAQTDSARALADALFDSAVAAHAAHTQNPMQTFEEYLRYVLGTTGVTYAAQSFAELTAERDAAIYLADRHADERLQHAHVTISHIADERDAARDQALSLQQENARLQEQLAHAGWAASAARERLDEVGDPDRR